MGSLKRSLTSIACVLLRSLRSAAPWLSSAPCAAAYCRLSNLLSPPAKGDNKATIAAAVLKSRLLKIYDSWILLGSSDDDVNRSSHRVSVPGSRPWTGSDQGLCPMKLFLASNLQRAGGEDDGAGASLPFSRRDMVGGHVPNPLCLLMHAANARHPQSGYHFELA